MMMSALPCWKEREEKKKTKRKKIFYEKMNKWEKEREKIYIKKGRVEEEKTKKHNTGEGGNSPPLDLCFHYGPRPTYTKLCVWPSLVARLSWSPCNQCHRCSNFKASSTHVKCTQVCKGNKCSPTPLLINLHVDSLRIQLHTFFVYVICSSLGAFIWYIHRSFSIKHGA
jgi:hypothetical protein